MTVLAFSVLKDVHPQSAFVGAGAEIRCGDAVIPGRVFLAHKAGEVAACVKLDGGAYMPGGYVSDLARCGNLGIHAEIAERNGCSIISRVWLNRSGGNAWTIGLLRDLMGSTTRDWSAAVTLASMAAGTRDALPVVYARRPHGDGEPTIINIHGDIGEDKAEWVAAYMGNPEHAQTVVLTIDSAGGNLSEAMAIYRLLAAWPRGVYANIGRQASSGAALIALAADVRTIRADGTMMLHQPAIMLDAAERFEVKDLLSAAQRMLDNTKEMAALIAVSTGNTIEVAEQWCFNEIEFDAGAALRCGLVHAIEPDAVPDKPRALRAKFKPISSPYRVAARAAQ